MTGDKTDVTALVKYAQSLEAEIERLRAALKPFADEAEFIIKNEDGWPEDCALYSDGKITISDYRRARDTLEQGGQDGCD